MTLCDSTKVTSSLAPPNFKSKRACHFMAQPLHLSSAAAPQPAGADINDCPLSEMPAEAAFGHTEDGSSSVFGPGSSDEKLIRALKNSKQSTHVIGVSTRKLRSLKFRLRRREIKMMQSGTPFNTREVVKNTNRQSAALARKRDNNGKFLNIPIYPDRHTNTVKSGKECQIFN